MNSQTTPIKLVASNEADTTRLAQALADHLPAHAAIALLGTLGAGKTHLVRELVGALGGNREDVVSPTFVLCQHYPCDDRLVHHLDAYRIQDDDEFLELGVEELFDSTALTFVEWADRVPACMPPEHVEIHVEVLGETTREFRLSCQDQALASQLAKVAAQYSG